LPIEELLPQFAFEKNIEKLKISPFILKII